MGENRFFFEFDNEYDLERVMEHEPWTYDKHLVIMERVLDNIPILESFSLSLCVILDSNT